MKTWVTFRKSKVKDFTTTYMSWTIDIKEDGPCIWWLTTAGACSAIALMTLITGNGIISVSKNESKLKPEKISLSSA